MAFFDERLYLLFSVSIPHETISSSKPRSSPPNELLSFLSHLQVSLEASYISPLPPASSGGPPTSALISPHIRQSLGVAAPRTASLNPKIGALHPPHTPNPIPVTSSPDTQYARTEGAVVHSYIWGEGREKEIVSAVGTAFSLLWSEQDKSWVALYKLDVAVVWMQTRFSDPLFSLTASVTLREKALAPTPQREPLMTLLATSSINLDTTELQEKDISSPSAFGLEEKQEQISKGLDEANLLGGLANGVTFGSEASDTLTVPTTRLGETIRRQAFSLISPSTPSASESNTPSTSRPVPPTLRKSYRKVLSAVSGIKVRMRTTFVPYVLLPGTDDEIEERRDAGSEERTVMLSVEVENSAESGMGFVVESVKVTIGGEGAKADLIGWDGLSADASSRLFPLKLRSVDQYNLLYAVSFLHPSSEDSFQLKEGTVVPNRNTETQRPLSIVIMGRPWDPTVEERDSESQPKLPPTKAFMSRWSSILDLVASSQLDPQDRPASPLSDHDALPMPATPFPVGSPTVSNATDSFSAITSKLPQSTNATPIAGSKRHTIAGLIGTKAERLGRKVLTANHRASTPVFSSSTTASVNAPSIMMTPNSPGRAGPPPPLSISVPVSPISGAPTEPQTPAFPGYASDSYFPLSPPSQVPISAPSGIRSVTEPRRQRISTGPLPLTPGVTNSGFGTGDYSIVPVNPGSEQDGNDVLLVSVSLLPPHRSGGSATALDNDHIFPLDVFALDIFVFNKSSDVRRCVISFPYRRKKERPISFDGRHPGVLKELPQGIIPLENNLIVGPLRPQTCQSVRMQFVALHPGTHTIDALHLHDYETETSTNLRSVMHVVVHEPPPAVASVAAVA
ncbi:hypothetical protein FRC03_001703 [Tulasnella sp. 419]|nr:hypothetical protein FRC03_001703 [Tulasnella sp. 419]